MTKNIRTFSEGITTGHRAYSNSGNRATVKSSRSPRFFRNYQEAEISMGSKEWDKLLQNIQKWKKEGGTLKAKLKGKKESIKMKAKVEKMPKLRFTRDMVVVKDPSTDSQIMTHYAATMTKQWEKTPEAKGLTGNGYIMAKTKFYDKAYDFIGNNIMTPVGTFNKLEKKAFPRLHQLDLLNENPFIPQGENYHCSVGWY